MNCLWGINIIGGILRTGRISSGAIVHDAIMVFEKKVRIVSLRPVCAIHKFEEICLTNKMKQYKMRKKGEENTIKYKLKNTNVKSNKNRIFSQKKMEKNSISCDCI